MIQKVNVLVKPLPRKRDAELFESEGYDEQIQLLLSPLTDFEEIEASETAEELHKANSCGYPIGGTIIDIPLGAWRLACRFNMMQDEDSKLYSPEEFIHMFAKYEGIAGKILDFMRVTFPAAEKKGPRQGSGSSLSASTEDSTHTLPSG